MYIKDLRVFQNWDLQDVILVDNAVYSFGFQLDNGIPIFPYIQGKDDLQLLYLKEYLVLLSQEETIRDLKKIFQMTYLSGYIDELELIYNVEEKEEECTGKLLDEMYNNQDFLNRASRSPSFGNGKFQYQNRLSTSDDPGQETTEEESKKSSPGIVPDHFIRSNSNNDEMLDPYGFNDPIDLDAVLMSNLDNHLLEPKGKKKKKGGRLTMLRKNPSVVYKKEKRLDSTGDLTQSLVDNNSSNNDSNKNAGTPKITAKKKTKRRKLKHLKGNKLAASAVTESEKLEDEP